jgi:hypothetical protein
MNVQSIFINNSPKLETTQTDMPLMSEMHKHIVICLSNLKEYTARCLWLMPVILAT